MLNWTGTLLAGLGETLVLLYLLLASGDLFLQKLVHVMPTLRDKKRAVEISHEIQQNISNYLFSVSLINLGLGMVVSGGLYFMCVPNAAMWGMFVALLNFVPYFGPVAGIVLLAAVGLLAFDTMWQGLLPPGWYLLLHLLEANLLTPVLLGRRFTLNPVVIFVSLIFWTWLWGCLARYCRCRSWFRSKSFATASPRCHLSPNFSPVEPAEFHRWIPMNCSRANTVLWADARLNYQPRSPRIIQGRVTPHSGARREGVGWLGWTNQE